MIQIVELEVLAQQVSKTRAIASARALLGQYFENIVIMCHLEPGKTWREWYDPYGNKLRVHKKTCTVKLSEGYGIHDIYYKSTTEYIAGCSYWMCFISTENQDTCWFIGHDGILRCLFKRRASGNAGIWKTCAPLYWGYKIIDTISKVYDIDYYKTLSVEFLGKQETLHITPWPAQQEIQELKEIQIV